MHHEYQMIRHCTNKDVSSVTMFLTFLFLKNTYDKSSLYTLRAEEKEKYFVVSERERERERESETEETILPEGGRWCRLFVN